LLAFFNAVVPFDNLSSLTGACFLKLNPLFSVDLSTDLVLVEAFVLSLVEFLFFITEADLVSAAGDIVFSMITLDSRDVGLTVKV